MYKHLFGFLTLLAVAGLWLPQAKADVITFDAEGLTGPVYGNVDVSTSIGTVVFSGGVLMTNLVNAPADETSIYWSITDLGSDPITITFPTDIHNFSLDVYNGLGHPGTYTISDNLGNSDTVTLPSNSSNGQALISFPTTGNIVTIFAPDTTFFDFFIDNIGFDQPTPTAVAEPSALGMFGLGVLLLGLLAGLRRRAG